MRPVTFYGVLDPKGWRVCDLLVLRLEWSSSLPIAPDCAQLQDYRRSPNLLPQGLLTLLQADLVQRAIRRSDA